MSPKAAVWTAHSPTALPSPLRTARSGLDHWNGRAVAATMLNASPPTLSNPRSDGVWRIQLLNAPALLQPGGPAPRHLASIDAALLAYLCTHGETDRSALATLLWPARGPTQSLANLRQRLRQFRLVSPTLLRMDGSIVALGEGVAHDLVNPVHVLSADPEALSGQLLGHHDYADAPELAAWVARERSRWSTTVHDALTSVATTHESKGQIARAIKAAARLVREDPTNEHGVRLLMRLHHRRGDRGAALAAYEACVQAMNDAFGDPVAEETVRLAQDIARSSEAAPAPVRAMPLALRHPPRTVAREACMALSYAQWEAQGTVLLTGPAGIGKTRVFDDLCRRWNIPVALRLGVGDAATPLRLLRRLLIKGNPVQRPGTRANGGAGHEPALVPEDGATIVELSESMVDAVLQGQSRFPRAIAIEDLHHADDESLAALLSLVRPDGPVRWLLTSRDAPLPAPLGDWLQRHDGLSDPMVRLREFDADELGTFLASLGEAGMQPLAWARALQTHCGGNPLRVLQVLRAAHHDGSYGRPLPPNELPRPATLDTYVARRLESADEATQQLAYVAALAGADFSGELFADATGRRAAELIAPWRRLEALGILRGRGFAHEIVRQAVLDAVPAPLRPMLHRDIARALSGHDGARERRATHWALAGRHDEAARDLAQAADDALALGLPVKARSLLERAERACLDANAGRETFDLRFRIGRLTLAWESADAARRVALELASLATDDRQRCLAACLLAHSLIEQHEASSLAESDRAVELAQASGLPELLAQASVARAMALHVMGRWPEALELIDSLGSGVLALLRPDDRQELEDTRVQVLAALGRRREAVQGASMARDRAVAMGRWNRAAELSSSMASQLGCLCRTEEEIAAAEHAIDTFRRLGASQGNVYVDMMTLAGAYVDIGRFRDALDTGSRAVDGLRQAGLTGWIVNAENSLASIFMLLGRFDLAAQRLPELGPDAALWARAAREMMRGMLWSRRSGASPLAHLERASAMFNSGGAQVNPYIEHRIAAEEAAWSPPEAALKGLDLALAWARDHEHEALGRIVRLKRVQVLLRHGQAAKAAEAADQLEAAFQAGWVASNLYLPEVWQSLTMAYDADGQQPRADKMAAHARAWLQQRLECDVPPLFAAPFCSANAVNRWLFERTGGPPQRRSRSDHAC